jgi:hypothetical protein
VSIVVDLGLVPALYSPHEARYRPLATLAGRVHPVGRGTVRPGTRPPRGHPGASGPPGRGSAPHRSPGFPCSGAWRPVGSRAREAMGRLRAAVYHSPAAEADLAEVIGWYESQRTGLAFELRLSLDATLDQVARYPEPAPGSSQPCGVHFCAASRMPCITAYISGSSRSSPFAHTYRDARVWRQRNH